MPVTKLLLLMRHAKSSWEDSDLRDIDRPLNARGRRDAPEMGRRLALRPRLPSLIVSSPALRARSTAEAMARQIGYVADIVVEDDLYGGSSEDVLDVVSVIDPAVQTVMVVGHNPTINFLANQFSVEPIENVPTCGILTLQLTEPQWNQVRAGMTVTEFDYPKKR